MLRPLNDLVYCERLTEQDSQIIITPVKKSTRCIVKAVGNGIFKGNKRIPCEAKVGDIVHIHLYEGLEQTVNGEKVIVIHDDEILGVEDDLP